MRDGDARRVTIKEGAPKGRHCVIVDDLVQTGGTLAESAKAVLAAGAAKVSCFVTHGVFPNQSWKKFVDGPHKGIFEKVWITDSVPGTAAAVQGQGPFEVLSLCHLVSSLIASSRPVSLS